MKLTRFMFKAAFFFLGGCFLAGGAVILTQGTSPVQAVLFLLIGAGLIYAAVKQIRRERQLRALREELMYNGKRVTGTVVDVRRASVRVNGHYARIATVRVKAPSGKEIEVDSEYLWTSLPQEGDAADVLFDLADESRYVIEFPEE